MYAIFKTFQRAYAKREGGNVMNFKTTKEIILASQSPRRQELLEKLGIPFQTRASDVDEVFEAEPSDLHQYVTGFAREKATAIAQKEVGKTVIGADTIVSFNGQVFPKPKDAKEAKVFLQTLSGNEHIVLTAVAVVNGNDVHTFVSETTVNFYTLDETLIDAYIQTGDPLDKAGAYGIQSGGALFVEGIAGDYYTVMGLPIAQLTRILLELNILEVEGCVNNG